MKLTARLCVPFVALAAACGHPRAQAPIGYDLAPIPSTPPPKPPPKRAPVPSDVVARARGAVTVMRLSDGATLAPLAFTEELLGFDAVCAGEEHDSAAQHYGELILLERLARRAPDLGLELGIGFEMWASKFQPALNAYQRGSMDEATLLDKTEYDERWGYPFAYYRPLLERARALGLPLVALNAPSEVTESVAETGLDDLDAEQKRQLPALDLDDHDHRADFDRRMKHHPGVNAKNLDNFYAAQVVWDETMADTAAKWLALHAPARRLLIIAGQAHCQHSAIPSRLERRGSARVAGVWLGTAHPPVDLGERFDYSLVVSGSDLR